LPQAPSKFDYSKKRESFVYDLVVALILEGLSFNVNQIQAAYR